MGEQRINGFPGSLPGRKAGQISRGCLWIDADPRDPDWCFCQAPRARHPDGRPSSYCEAHRVRTIDVAGTQASDDRGRVIDRHLPERVRG